MIKDIFLPEKIGSYYLFSKRIVGIDIGKTHIHATSLRLKGTQIIIEQCYEIPIEANQTTNSERVVIALKQLQEKIGSFDELYSSLSSTLIIFKELKLPFLQYEKLKMVVPFEVEPLLPFPASDAVID